MHDIRDAQAAGIDGFALNCGEWGSPGANLGNYQLFVSEIFHAARELNSGFKLFFSADMSGKLSTEDIRSMIKQYTSDPCYFKYLGKPVLSTWGAESKDSSANRLFWTQQIITPLKSSGYDICFVPMFHAQSPSRNGVPVEVPSPMLVQENYVDSWEGWVDGLFYPSVAGLPIDFGSLSMSTAADAFSSELHSDGRLFMSGVSPSYWAETQANNGRRYFEYNGGEGIEQQWNSILHCQLPTWVELFTWNDFSEDTYWSPIDDIHNYNHYVVYSTIGHYPSHAGALALTSYYINWYKTGRQPTNRNGVDNIFYFYRLHPKNDIAPSDPYGPVKTVNGGVSNTIYFTSILPNAAQLKVMTGSKTYSFSMRPGLSNIRIPFEIGPQTFQLWRGDKCLIDQHSRPITSTNTEYNFHIFSGSAHD